MLCYWGLDSAIERGTIKASNLPGNRCCAGMSSLCSMWENFFPWKNPPPFLFLCARGHNPDPKHGHHCDPKTRDCPIKSLPLLFFFGGGARMKALSSISWEIHETQYHGLPIWQIHSEWLLYSSFTVYHGIYKPSSKNTVVHSVTFVLITNTIM